jgi:hypothetical protein
MMGMVGWLFRGWGGCNEQVGLAPYNGARKETCDGDDYMQIVDARGLNEPRREVIISSVSVSVSGGMR